MSGLLDTPWNFDFYQALRLLENGRVPGVAGRAIGHDHPPREEVARLRGTPSLGFPPTAIETLQLRRSPISGRPNSVEVTIAFAGALGACGALPWHYTEYVFERLSLRDRSLREFIDALQHRSLSFLYRSWRKYRLPFAYEAADRERRTDDVTAALRGLVGLGTDHLRERLPEGDHRWVFFAGLFAGRQRTAQALAAMVEASCGYGAEVQEFVGRWQPLGPAERSRLGGTQDDTHNRLGTSLILGASVWDVLSGVRIRIGPIDARHLPDFTAGSGRFRWLGDLVKSYLGPERDFEIACLVDPATVRPARLGGPGACLGGSVWLASDHTEHYDTAVPVWSSR